MQFIRMKFIRMKSEITEGGRRERNIHDVLLAITCTMGIIVSMLHVAVSKLPVKCKIKED